MYYVFQILRYVCFVRKMYFLSLVINYKIVLQWFSFQGSTTSFYTLKKKLKQRQKQSHLDIVFMRPAGPSPPCTSHLYNLVKTVHTPNYHQLQLVTQQIYPSPRSLFQTELRAPPSPRAPENLPHSGLLKARFIVKKERPLKRLQIVRAANEPHLSRAALRLNSVIRK